MQTLERLAGLDHRLKLTLIIQDGYDHNLMKIHTLANMIHLWKRAYSDLGHALCSLSGFGHYDQPFVFVSVLRPAP
jgi:hypothetical protein